MRYKVKNATRGTVQTPVSSKEHHHFWLIELASGPTSRGVCKICGEKKEFSNIILEESAVPPKKVHPLQLPELSGVDFNKEERKQ